MDQASSPILSRIHLDVRSKIPFFEQIAAQIRVNIVSRELRPDEQLPTVRQLAELLQINFNTVARAYRLLEMEDLISTQQGRGTFVLTPLIQPTPEETRQKHLAELAQRIAGLVTSSGFTLEEINSFFSTNSVNVTEQKSIRWSYKKKLSRLTRKIPSCSPNFLFRLMRSDLPNKVQKKRLRPASPAAKDERY